MARQTGLGRGLGALIPGQGGPEEGQSQTTGSAYRELPVGAIGVNPYQPRDVFDEETLSALTASVREVGVLQPVLVRVKGPDTFELIAGERRWRAAKRAGLKTIPAIVRDVEDFESLEHALVENLHRQDLGPLEEAAAYQQLIDDFAMTQEAVAQRMGKSRSAVANALRLLQLPAGVQVMLVNRSITAGHARALLGLTSRQEQDRLAHLVVSDELSVRDVERLVREGLPLAPSKPSATKVRGPKPAAVLEVEHRLGDRLQTKVTVQAGTKRGKVVIDFADLDDLSRIFDLIDGS